MSAYGQVQKCSGDAGFVPFRFQGQYHDRETGLYYNRFRYYSPQEGMYISQDPIGLLGGRRLYAYVLDPNTWLDVFGLAAWEIGKFGEWFNKASVQDILDNKDSVEAALRGDGGMHEKFPVSMGAKAKELGFTYEELSSMTVETHKIQFENVLDNDGNIIPTGRHPSPAVGDMPRVYNSRASRYFHAKLMEDLNTATTKEEAISIINTHHNNHMTFCQ